MASLSTRIVLSLHSAVSSTLRFPLPCFACIHFSPFSSHTIIPSPSPSPPNPQTPHPPIYLFLLTECEFSPSQISQIMKNNKRLLKTRCPHTAREAVEFLKQWGFTQSQLKSIILGSTNVLISKVETMLKPKFHYFRTLGFTDQELRNLISFNPRMLCLNLESNIIPKISFIKTLLGSKPDIIKTLKRSPSLLASSMKNLKLKLDFFKQWGIQGELLSLLLSADPNVLGRNKIESLRLKMEYARNTMGVVQGSKTFVYAICVLTCIGPEKVEKKIKHLQCLGLLENEVHELLKKYPMILAFSTNKMQENIDFLTQTAGLKPNVVISYPYLFSYSLKKRLMPRHAVFKALSSEQQSVRNIVTLFGLSERNFLEKIVECNPQASKLKEIYKSTIDSADIGIT